VNANEHGAGTTRRAATAVKRPYGTGCLLLRRDRRGGETWYGKWWAAGRRCVDWGRNANPAAPSG
jgi:hypothetical protein